MKKNRAVYSLIIIGVIISLFASCKQDVIFYDIAEEIEYEAPIVEGNVFSMVPCGGMLFVQNNSIYKKGWLAEKNDNGKWTKTSSPVAGKNVVRLASDENYLYALVINTDTNEDSAVIGDVYAAPVTDGVLGSWSKKAENVVELFDNKCFNSTDGTTVGRNAYFTDADNKVSKLAGAGTPVVQPATDVLGDTSEDAYIRTAGTAASDGTSDYFCSNSAFAVLNISGTTYFYTFIVGDGTNIVSDGTKIKYKAADAESFSDGGTTASIITTLTSYGADKLLVGTQAGYEVSPIGSNGKPGNGVTPSENAESAFGTRYINGIWQYGASGTLYASVVEVGHSQYNKLWGFYTSRNKWNYE